MYILAKNVESSDGFTLHGITLEDKVAEAWSSAGGSYFNIDEDDPITFLPVQPVEFDEPETDE